MWCDPSAEFYRFASHFQCQIHRFDVEETQHFIAGHMFRLSLSDGVQDARSVLSRFTARRNFKVTKLLIEVMARPIDVSLVSRLGLGAAPPHFVWGRSCGDVHEIEATWEELRQMLRRHLYVSPDWDDEARGPTANSRLATPLFHDNTQFWCGSCS